MTHGTRKPMTGVLVMTSLPELGRVRAALRTPTAAPC